MCVVDGRGKAIIFFGQAAIRIYRENNSKVLGKELLWGKGRLLVRAAQSHHQ